MKKISPFLPYPLVQFIPVPVRTLGKDENWVNPFNQAKTQFYLFQDPLALKSALERFQAPSAVPANGEELYVLALNFQVRLVLFRYLTCKLIGESRVNSYHVFALTKKYFPRRVLHFVLYEDNGTKLRELNQEIY
jgi:hypothetical protein